MPETIQENLVVSLAYELRLADGEVVDSAPSDDPLEYLHGADNIIPGLERALTGMRVGERKAVEVSPEDGYGIYDPEDIQEIGREMLPADMPLEIGTPLVISDEDGNVMEAIISGVSPRTITIDFNHPLAGKALFFNVEVLGIRDATREEIEHGHPHDLDGGDEFDEDDEDFDEDDFEMEFDDDDDLDEDEFDIDGGVPSTDSRAPLN